MQSYNVVNCAECWTCTHQVVFWLLITLTNSGLTARSVSSDEVGILRTVSKISEMLGQDYLFHCESHRKQKKQDFHLFFGVWKVKKKFVPMPGIEPGATGNLAFIWKPAMLPTTPHRIVAERGRWIMIDLVPGDCEFKQNGANRTHPGVCHQWRNSKPCELSLQWCWQFVFGLVIFDSVGDNLYSEHCSETLVELFSWICTYDCGVCCSCFSFFSYIFVKSPNMVFQIKWRQQTVSRSHWQDLFVYWFRSSSQLHHVLLLIFVQHLLLSTSSMLCVYFCTKLWTILMGNRQDELELRARLESYLTTVLITRMHFLIS